MSNKLKRILKFVEIDPKRGYPDLIYEVLDRSPTLSPTYLLRHENHNGGKPFEIYARHCRVTVNWR